MHKLVPQEGKVFNASFFDDPDKMKAFLAWYSENALHPGSKYHRELSALLSRLSQQAPTMFCACVQTA